jgi:hypothetical protein
VNTTEIYKPEFNCFLPCDWNGIFPVWGVRYAPCGVVRLQIFDGQGERDRVLNAFNFQAGKLGLVGFKASPEGERAIVYPNGHITLPELLECDKNSLAYYWIDEFLGNMVKLWPNQALTDFGLEAIGVPHHSRVLFCLDWSSSILGANRVRREFPSPRHYRLFLCQFGRLCHEAEI